MGTASAVPFFALWRNRGKGDNGTTSTQLTVLLPLGLDTGASP